MIFHCPFCGGRVRPADRDCPHCGRRATRECPWCTEEIAADTALCKYCGEEVAPAPAPSPRPAPAPARPEVEFLEEPVVRRCAWENTSRGFLRRWWGTWMESNFSPSRFFRAMPPSGGHRWPVGFTFGFTAQFLVLAVLVAVGIASGAALTGNPLEPRVLRWGAVILIAAIPLSFLAVTVGLYVVSAFWHLVVKILGAKEGFEATLRIVGYSTGTQVWGLIPYLGIVLQPVVQTVLYYHGFREVHGMSKGRALVAALLPLLVAAGIAVLVALAFLLAAAGGAPAGA